MSTSLPKLHILLQDILSNAKAIRTQQCLNYSFGERNYITFLDVKNRFKEIWNERDSFINFDEINSDNAGDFLMENVVFYFFTRAMQIRDSAFFKEETQQLKDLVFKTIGYIHSSKLMDETLEDERFFFDKNTSKTNKPVFDAFFQLIKAEMPKDAYFDHALGFYIGTASKEMEKKNSYWYFKFKPIFDYACNAQDSKKFSVLINEIIVKYFYFFCDLQTIDKKFMHTELSWIERRILNNKYESDVLGFWNINYIYNMVCIDCLIRSDKRQRFLEELMAKIFYNDYSIFYSLQSNRDSVELTNYMWKNKTFKDFSPTSDIAAFKRDDYYTTPYQLFSKIFYEYKDELDKNPGIVVSLYLLSTEMDADSFFAFFSLEKDDERDRKLTTHYLKKIENTLGLEDIINRNLEINGERGKKYRRFHNIFEGYRKAIKEGKTEEILKLQKERQNKDMGLDSELDLKTDLLQRFLWLLIVFKCGLYYDNDENVYKVTTDRDKMLIPFCNGLMSNEYANIDYINANFNLILKKLGIDNKIDLSIKKITDYKNIVLLVYNLSRAEFNSREFLINEINSIRELQKEVLHVDIKDVSRREHDQAKAEETKEYNKASRTNLEKLKKIDCGFKLKTYSQSFYPFSADKFKSKNIYLKENGQGLFSCGYEHSIKCKLVWETDNEYSNGGLDWATINERGMETRYLYRDRNSYTHHTDHSSVKSLLSPISWKNLLRSLAYYDVLLRKQWSERITYREGYNIQEDDFFFQNLYIESEVEDIYRILTQLIQEKTQIPLNQRKNWILFDESKYKVESERSALTVEEFIKHIEENKKTKEFVTSYSEIPDNIDPNHDIFELRLERLLKIMFMVNDFDPVDQKHSVKFMDFYSQYNMEISIYLIYMAFALNYCDDVKV